MLEIRNLAKVYPNGVQALKGISLSIEPGEFVVLLGLSGSGKSTLLRCINRLIEPTAGDIVLNDRNVTQANQAELRGIRREIGMIFQQFNLVKRAQVLTNVMCGNLGYQPTWYSLFNRFQSDARERALANLARVGILDKAYVRADSLSGGQQQRVGIARALMQRPRLMLADEPVASLDPATSHSVMQYLEQINRGEGLTVICALHFLSLARRYATRIIALKDGELIFDGSPKAIDEARFKEIYGEDAIEVEIR
jgi:phosphonate transport system ATP-binding protein